MYYISLFFVCEISSNIPTMPEPSLLITILGPLDIYTHLTVQMLEYNYVFKICFQFDTDGSIQPNDQPERVKVHRVQIGNFTAFGLATSR